MFEHEKISNLATRVISNTCFFNSFGIIIRINDFSARSLEMGHPYNWVQKICGLDFPSLDSKTPEVSLFG